ncbi:ArsR/SmtB family transcription factor [Actinoplanes utahensis]|uniref:ArsR/SmtB family transcription factor n=1 Tax=Actinoplanes utahensis TaxID=1869 RepID=UPI00068AE789|nr:winged helix-turn-helix domain-containing protein [Actinoplanes utahensis]GIF32409.1 hypothetical protein Aut01nite_53950 [Actinoplanes utahensis]
MRIVFSAEGLARVRLLSTHDPVSETIFAARLFSRSAGAALFDRWRRSVRVRLGHPAQQIGPMAQQMRPVAELFRIPFGDGDTGTPTNTLLRRFHDTAVAPYRQAMSAFLEADRTTRGNIILTSGVDGFLRSLHPLATWQFPVLEIPNGSDRTIRVDERGLLVTPSLFHFDRPEVFGANAGPDGGPPVLVYTPPVNSETAARLWDAEVHSERALAALLGRTRSRLLAALAGGSSTTELGRRLGVSAASVSQHTGVLRDAGLITTQRRQNTVQHSLTPLGAALVDRAVPRGPVAVAGPALLRAS